MNSVIEALEQIETLRLQQQTQINQLIADVKTLSDKLKEEPEQAKSEGKL
jgi:hypothetical protein